MSKYLWPQLFLCPVRRCKYFFMGISSVKCTLLSFLSFQYFWHQTLFRNFASSLLSNLFPLYFHKQSTTCSQGLLLIKLLCGWFITFVSGCKVTFLKRILGYSSKKKKKKRLADKPYWLKILTFKFSSPLDEEAISADILNRKYLAILKYLREIKGDGMKETSFIWNILHSVR